MYKTPTRPALNTPLQTPAVHRNPWEAPADRSENRGAEAARSMCGDLTGSGRELCRALQRD